MPHYIKTSLFPLIGGFSKLFKIYQIYPKFNTPLPRLWVSVYFFTNQKDSLEKTPDTIQPEKIFIDLASDLCE